MANELKAAAVAAGADLVGVADLEPFKAEGPVQLVAQGRVLNG